jgi:tRNA threonylcarbamoyladenosine biosynthesis protein TsaB
MKILALEFSTNRRSVAVAGTNPDFRLLATSTEDNPRGSNGMVLIDRALHEAHLAPAEIDIIAIGLGPGSYAGTRSAIAISQGWQLARGTRLLGISSVDVLAHEAQQSRHFGDVTIIIDAQRKEAYTARYHITESHIQELTPLQISAVADFALAGNLLGPAASHLIPGSSDLYPTAGTLARLAATRSDFRPGEALEPIYLREISFVKAAIPKL